MELRTVEYPVLQPRTSKEVRVLSWNIWYGGSSAHTDEVAAALQQFDCDVLLLYELNYELQFPGKIIDLGYGGVFVETNYFGNRRPIKGGIGLFSRFPMTGTRVVETRLTDRRSARRCYIEAKLQVSDNYCLTVGMTHNALPWDAHYKTTCEAIHREVGKHSERFLFAGDLNALPWSRFVRELRKQLVHLGPPLHKTSYPTRRLVRWLTPPRRVDYVFGTSDLKAQEVRFGESWPSDHRPIFVRLKAEN